MTTHKYQVGQVVTVPTASGVPSILLEVLSQGTFEDRPSYRVAISNPLLSALLTKGRGWFLSEASIDDLALVPTLV